MVDKSMSGDIDLETFLKTAGQSFTDAQKSLISGLGLPVNMMLNNAELELKVAVRTDAMGRMSIKPVSSDDITRGGIDTGMLSTIRINFVSSVGEIKVQSQPVSTEDSTIRETIVPDLTNLTMDEAVNLLKAGKWHYTLHAADSAEIESGREGSQGRVVRQQPQASRSVEKESTEIELWVNLGAISVKKIDGIGDKLGENLSRIGINTIGELSLMETAQIASELHISENRAQNYREMAGLMAHLVISGFSDEVVELLVIGAGIRTMEQLAQSEPGELYNICQETITTGKVRVPREFSFSKDDVKRWIKTAREYIQ